MPFCETAYRGEVVNVVDVEAVISACVVREKDVHAVYECSLTAVSPAVIVSRAAKERKLEIILYYRALETLHEAYPRLLEDTELIVKAFLNAVGRFCRIIGDKREIAACCVDIDEIRLEFDKIGRTENRVLVEFVVLRLVELRFNAEIQQKKFKSRYNIVSCRAAENGYFLFDASCAVSEQLLFESLSAAHYHISVKRKIEFFHGFSLSG